MSDTEEQIALMKMRVGGAVQRSVGSAVGGPSCMIGGSNKKTGAARAERLSDATRILAALKRVAGSDPVDEIAERVAREAGMDEATLAAALGSAEQAERFERRRVDVEVPEDAWEEADDEADSRLSAPLWINGRPHHLIAMRVERDEDGTQCPVGPYGDEDYAALEKLYEPDGGYGSVVIRTKRYVLYVVPASE